MSTYVSFGIRLGMFIGTPGGPVGIAIVGAIGGATGAALATKEVVPDFLDLETNFFFNNFVFFILNYFVFFYFI